MIISLKPGEKLVVEFAESDGQFEIHFDSEEHPDAIVVKETAFLPGSVCGVGGETLYCEKFYTPDDKSEIGPIGIEDDCPETCSDCDLDPVSCGHFSIK